MNGLPTENRQAAQATASPHGAIHRKTAGSVAACTSPEDGMRQMRIHDIVHDKRGISPDTALRLARSFGTTPEFWLNMQMLCELERTCDRLGDEIARTMQPCKA